MHITDIRPRRKGLSALYLDGEYAVSLDTQTLLEHRINTGCELSDEDLRELIEMSSERRAKEKALWLISYRDHSKKELKDKLVRTCDADAADKAVARMEALGLVNDDKFARQYARRLLLEKKLTCRAAAFELTRKGIDRETAEKVLGEIDVDYRGNIREIIEKKYRNIQDEKVKRRAVAALQRLGYGWDDIKAVLEEYTDTDY